MKTTQSTYESLHKRIEYQPQYLCKGQDHYQKLNQETQGKNPKFSDSGSDHKNDHLSPLP